MTFYNTSTVFDWRPTSFLQCAWKEKKKNRKKRSKSRRLVIFASLVRSETTRSYAKPDILESPGRSRYPNQVLTKSVIYVEFSTVHSIRAQGNEKNEVRNNTEIHHWVNDTNGNLPVNVFATSRGVASKNGKTSGQDTRHGMCRLCSSCLSLICMPARFITEIVDHFEF